MSKTYQDIVGEYVWNFVSKAFSNGLIDTKLVRSLIIPNSKADVTYILKDFHTISFCNVFLKTCFKVLVLHIRLFLDKFIGPVDNDIFLRGCAPYAQEKRKRNVCFLRNNFVKAYDQVDWKFHKLTLEDFGFLINIVDLIEWLPLLISKNGPTSLTFSLLMIACYLQRLKHHN